MSNSTLMKKPLLLLQDLQENKINIFGSGKSNYTYYRRVKEERKIDSSHVKSPTHQPNKKPNPHTSNPYVIPQFWPLECIGLVM